MNPGVRQAFRGLGAAWIEPAGAQVTDSGRTIRLKIPTASRGQRQRSLRTDRLGSETLDVQKKLDAAMWSALPSHALCVGHDVRLEFIGPGRRVENHESFDGRRATNPPTRRGPSNPTSTRSLPVSRIAVEQMRKRSRMLRAGRQLQRKQQLDSRNDL